jgi:hypothetical protein
MVTTSITEKSKRKIMDQQQKENKLESDIIEWKILVDKSKATLLDRSCRKFHSILEVKGGTNHHRQNLNQYLNALMIQTIREENLGTRVDLSWKMWKLWKYRR